MSAIIAVCAICVAAIVGCFTKALKGEGKQRLVARVICAMALIILLFMGYEEWRLNANKYVMMPDVKGMYIYEAMDELRKCGLYVDVLKIRGEEENVVIAQVPEKNSKVEVETTVTIFIGEYAEEPQTEEPPTETPETEAPETEAPVTEAPVTEAPETEAPVTEAPVTEAPVTEAPVTEAPVTEAPETKAPETEAPVTEAPVIKDSKWEAMRYYNNGCNLAKEGKYEEAIRAFKESLKYEEESGTYYNIACMYHIYLKDCESAIPYYLLALEMDPDEIGTLSNLSNCYREVGDEKMAKYYSDKCKEVREKNGL